MIIKIVVNINQCDDGLKSLCWTMNENNMGLDLDQKPKTQRWWFVSKSIWI